MTTAPDPSEEFEPHRRHLAGLAYRMLGSVSEAEDMVQEAYLRWHLADRSEVEAPRAFLSRIVTRLCLDHLKSARTRREQYVGAWLPEPLLDSEAYQPASATELADDLSIALLLALERLTPPERAAFLLHDVFDQEYDEIARTLDKSEAACRQLVARARGHVRAARPRRTVSAEEERRVTEAFFHASQSGDITALSRVLAEHSVLLTDGGGKKPAALNPIRGRQNIARLLYSISVKSGPAKDWIFRPLRVNGLPGCVLIEPDGTIQTIALEIGEGVVQAIYLVRNPDKLAHVAH